MGRHLVLVLLLGSLVEQVQQQFEQAAVGSGEDQEQQLEGFDLALFVRSAGLVPLLIKQRQVCQITRQNMKDTLPSLRAVCCNCLSFPLHMQISYKPLHSSWPSISLPLSSPAPHLMC